MRDFIRLAPPANTSPPDRQRVAGVYVLTVTEDGQEVTLAPSEKIADILIRRGWERIEQDAETLEETDHRLSPAWDVDDPSVVKVDPEPARPIKARKGRKAAKGKKARAK